jgi:diguanylate cyclase (GGDEF)-like protein
MPRSASHTFLSRIAARLPGLGGLFAVVLLPGVIAGIVLSYAIYKNERSTLEQGSLQTARALLQAIDSDIATVQSLAVALSRSELLQTGDFRSFHQRAREVIELSGVGHNGVLSNLQGRQLLNTAVPFASPLPEHGNPRQIQAALELNRPVLSNLYQGAVLKRPLISIDVPVLRDGEPAYILSIGLLPDHFNQLVVQQQLPAGWIATVLDAADVVVGRNVSPQTTIGKSATPDLRQQIALRGQGIMASRSLEGKPTFIAFSKSTVTGWSIVVGMNQEVLYRDLYDLQLLVAIAVVAMLLASLTLLWLFSSHIRRSLRGLGSATEATVEQGVPALAPTNSSIREIDQLALKFNAMQDANHKMEQRIRAMAFQDPLTGLANRRLLVDRLEQVIAHNGRTGEFSALVFIDLDNFKPLNDTHGHGAGDDLLEEVAGRLRTSLRDTDTAARFGGDEFVVLISQLGHDAAHAEHTAAAVANKLLAELAVPYALSLAVTASGLAVHHVCTASMGVLVFSGNINDVDAILEQADAAMYQAKMAGRNQVVVKTAHLEVPAETP